MLSLEEVNLRKEVNASLIQPASHLEHADQPWIWRQAFGGVYCGPCAGEGRMVWRYRRGSGRVLRPREVLISVPPVSRNLLRRAAHLPEPEKAIREGTAKDRVFKYLIANPDASLTKVAEATGVNYKTAGVYRAAWRRGERR